MDAGKQVDNSSLSYLEVKIYTLQSSINVMNSLSFNLVIVSWFLQNTVCFFL